MKSAKKYEWELPNNYNNLWATRNSMKLCTLLTKRFYHVLVTAFGIDFSPEGVHCGAKTLIQSTASVMEPLHHQHSTQVKLWALNACRRQPEKPLGWMYYS